MREKHIYLLRLNSKPFYVGQTFDIPYRLKTHIKNNEYLLSKPANIRQTATIEIIETCDCSEANIIERYWLKYYKIAHNVKNINTGTGSKGYTKNTPHIQLTSQQQIDIKKRGFIDIANLIGVKPGTIRVAAAKKRIKKEYFIKIFGQL